MVAFVHVVFSVGLGFHFVYLVFVHEAAGSVVVLEVVFFLSVWSVRIWLVLGIFLYLGMSW